MRFETTASQNGTSYILKDTSSGTQAEIYTFGALLNKFMIKKENELINVVDGYTSVEDAKQTIAPAFKSAKLCPFVCRLDSGAFSFENENYQITKYNIGSSAIHGLVYDAVFKVSSTHADDNKATLVLHYAYDTTENGFPFSFLIDVHYKLDAKNILSITTTVTNNGKNNMPLNDGWHPYFKMGKSINTAEIKFNSKEIVEFSDALLPTGKTSAYDLFNDFKVFGNTELDNCFTLNNHTEAAFQMKDYSAGIQLSIYPDSSYPYLQIYTPPSRESIAVENLTSAPDSFNNKMNLLMLKPEETKHFTTSYQLNLL